MERRGNMRNSKAVAEMIIYEQEFRREQIGPCQSGSSSYIYGTQQRPKVESYSR
jgi:hypothetical protein